MFQKEENLSKHNQGNCFNVPFTDDSLLEDAGCVRIPLFITVDYEEEVESIEKGKRSKRKRTRTQKQCIEIEVLIQPRIDPDIISDSLLENAIKFLNSTIGLIEEV